LGIEFNSRPSSPNEIYESRQGTLIAEHPPQQRARREFWGYAPDEALPPDDLILEKYRGIHPAPSYPAQPDHTEKSTLFRLLDAQNTTGVNLTESFEMWPGPSVFGL
jgi:5-methyltetrahydrofolate--homocysteine methyltransferase